MSTSWDERQTQWQAFRAWEWEQLRSRPTDFSHALQWMSDAWELAQRFDPSWGTREPAESHWRHLAEIQRALARLRLMP